MSAAPESLLDLLRRFRAAQEKRPAVYKQLDVAFAALLESGELDPYVEATKLVTKQFGDISTEVRLVEDKLKSLEPPSPFAAKIRQIQELERDKLQLTSQIQILRKEHEEHRDHYEAFEEAEYETSLQKEKLRLNSLIESINEVLEEIRSAEFDLHDD